MPTLIFTPSPSSLPSTSSASDQPSNSNQGSLPILRLPSTYQPRPDPIWRLKRHVGRLLGRIVGAFWSLSYPLSAYIETLTSQGIHTGPDPAEGLRRAAGFVDALIGLLAPGGHLLAKSRPPELADRLVAYWMADSQ